MRETSTIPLEYPADWEDYYWSANETGLCIHSRYFGVSTNVQSGTVYWTAKYNGAPGAKWLGRYPFTREGERQAAIAYETHVAFLNYKPIRPGRVMKGKIHFKI